MGDTIGEKKDMPCNVVVLLGWLFRGGCILRDTVPSPIDNLMSDPKLEPRLSRLPAITLALSSSSSTTPPPSWPPFVLFVTLNSVGTLGLDDLGTKRSGGRVVGTSAWELEDDGSSTKTDSV